MPRPLDNLTGRKFGRLTILKRLTDRVRNGHRNVVWQARCDCSTIIEAQAGNLRTGNQRSCGCFQREDIARRNRTHGLSHHPEYALYTAMVQRCTDPRHVSYPNYGGRGITVCDRWLASFEHFFEDIMREIGPCPRGLTIDRIDNARGYAPGNVRWATRKEQAANRRQRKRPS